MELKDIERVGVVGGGTMGFGISINFALAGYKTVVYDLNSEVLQQSMKQIRSSLDMFVEESLVTEDQASGALGQISTTTDLAEMAAQSDFVTEAIVERLKDKQETFNQLDELCPPHTILVSNTSGFVLSEIGEGVKRQEKIGLTHYFAPPHIVPGVEVAKGPGTTDETYEIIYDLMKKTGRRPIRVLKELPGYLLNRIQGAMGREATRLWAEGVATAEEIEKGIQATFGFRMPHEGPFLHHDLAGIWKWPADSGNPGGREPVPEPSEEAVQRLAARDKGKPWFVDPEKFDEAIEKRDREYIRRLKELYGESGK